MEITRITFRIPKFLITKVKVLANQNQISLNQQLVELVGFGIKYFLEKTGETEIVKSEES